MKTRAFLLPALLAMLALAAAAQAPSPPTPAERQFRAWLAAFNGGDRATLLGFLENEYAARGAGPNQQFRPVAEDGGYYHFIARHSDRTPFELWRELGLPSFVVMSLPSFKVETVVPRVT